MHHCTWVVPYVVYTVSLFVYEYKFSVYLHCYSKCTTSYLYYFMVSCVKNYRQHSFRILCAKATTLILPFCQLCRVCFGFWFPHTQSQKNILEMVQRKAARFVFNSYTRNTSVTDLLNRLDWLTLEDRRNYAKVTMFYKKLIVSIDFLSYLHPSSTITRGHNQRFILISTRVNWYHHSFLPSTIRIWNSLPIKVVAVENVNDFQTKLHTCTFTRSYLNSLCIKSNK